MRGCYKSSGTRPGDRAACEGRNEIEWVAAVSKSDEAMTRWPDHGSYPAEGSAPKQRMVARV